MVVYCGIDRIVACKDATDIAEQLPVHRYGFQLFVECAECECDCFLLRQDRRKVRDVHPSSGQMLRV